MERFWILVLLLFLLILWPILSSSWCMLIYLNSTWKYWFWNPSLWFLKKVNIISVTKTYNLYFFVQQLLVLYYSKYTLTLLNTFPIFTLSQIWTLYLTNLFQFSLFWVRPQCLDHNLYYYTNKIISDGLSFSYWITQKLQDRF